MILVDLSQISIAAIMAALGKHTNSEIELPIIRHMILNTVRSINSKFRDEYGELVVCCDSTNNWRRDVFPHYKAARRKNAAASDTDWKQIFHCIKTVKEELREYFPYRVIEVDRAEADDVIGALTHFMSGQHLERILIVSGDKDFMQLQVYPNVTQYDPVHTKAVKLSEDPRLFLAEHVLKGDVGDGVPNVLSDDDTFVDPDKKQRPLTKKKMAALLDGTYVADESDRPIAARIERNRTLIDLSKIPQDIQSRILTVYMERVHGDRSRLMEYFAEHGLKQLVEKAGDF
jgi:5'-3' exonuclease